MDQNSAMRAFIAMPFHPSLDWLYAIVEKNCLICGIEPRRVDRIAGVENIWDAIVEEIRNCDLVIADFSPDPMLCRYELDTAARRNAANTNVATEAGYARALGKPVILLTSDPESLPFDWRVKLAIVYPKDMSNVDAIMALHRRLESALDSEKAKWAKRKKREAEESERQKDEMDLWREQEREKLRQEVAEKWAQLEREIEKLRRSEAEKSDRKAQEAQRSTSEAVRTSDDDLIFERESPGSLLETGEEQQGRISDNDEVDEMFGEEHLGAVKDMVRKDVEEEEIEFAKPTWITSDDGRYRAYADGVIEDPKTGLEWYCGPDEDTTWDMAHAWVCGLTVAGGGWRMPTIKELEGIVVAGTWAFYPRYLDPVFPMEGGYWMWSGELCDDRGKPRTQDGNLPCARGFDLGISRADWYGRNRRSGGRVFAVRKNHVIRTSDDGRFQAYVNGIIEDTKTGLEWYVGPQENTSWDEAEVLIFKLTVAGGGWRMPTIAELKGIAEKGKRKNEPKYLDLIFPAHGYYVWSGEVCNEKPHCAHVFTFHNDPPEILGRCHSHGCRWYAVRTRKKWRI